MSAISATTSQAGTAIDAAKSKVSLDKLALAAKAGTGLTKDAANDKDAAKKMDQVNKTATDFEAVFVTEMLKPMFNMINVDKTFGGGKGEEVFRDFLLTEYGKKMASQGGFGIAPHIKAELLKMQEHAAPAAIQ